MTGLDRLRAALRVAETERDEALTRMAEFQRVGSIGHNDAVADRDDALRTIEHLRARIAEEETDALRPISSARLRELADVAPGPHGSVLIDAAFLRALARELLSARESGAVPSTTPPTRDEVIAHEKHGGFWFVSRVENALYGAESDVRPMVLRVLIRDDRFVATIPSNDFGGYWKDDDPFRLMPGATWAPLDSNGVPMARETKEDGR